jgi:hypothetical protein
MDQTHPSVVRRGTAQQQTAGFQAVQHAARGGGVKADGRRQRALVHARLALGRGQGCKLHGRQVQALRLLHEEGHGKLLKTSNQMPGLGLDVRHAIAAWCRHIRVFTDLDAARISLF